MFQRWLRYLILRTTYFYWVLVNLDLILIILQSISITLQIHIIIYLSLVTSSVRRHLVFEHIFMGHCFVTGELHYFLCVSGDANLSDANIRWHILLVMFLLRLRLFMEQTLHVVAITVEVFLDYFYIH